MHDPPSAPTAGEGSDRGSITGTPRWVKLVGVIALVLVLLIGVMLLTGRGSHGPGRHAPSGDAGAKAPASSLTDPSGGHTPPAGGHTQP